MTPTPPEATAPGAAARSAWRSALLPLLVSLGVVVAVVLLRWIRVPLVNRDLGTLLAGASAPARGHFSLLFLGLAPVVTAHLAVELAAWALPSLRPLRAGSPDGRQRLADLAAGLSLLLAGLEAVLLVRLMRQWAWLGRDLGSAALVVLALVGGVALLLGGMKAVDRWGLGSGFGAVLAGLLMNDLLGTLARTAGGPGSPARLLAFFALLVVLPMAFRRSAEALAQPAGRSDQVFPTAGALPLLWPGLLLGGMAVWRSGVAVLVHPAPGGAAGLATWLGSDAAATGLVLLSVPFFALQTGRPRRAYGRGLSWSLALTLGLLGLQRLLATEGDPLDAVALVYLAAIGTDLAREFRFRVEQGGVAVAGAPAGTSGAAPGLRVLAGSGVPAFVRGLHLRALLQAFGPMVPLRLIVPEREAERARKALGRG